MTATARARRAAISVLVVWCLAIAACDGSTGDDDDASADDDSTADDDTTDDDDTMDDDDTTAADDDSAADDDDDTTADDDDDDTAGFLLELPLTDQADTLADVAAFGGTVTGGSFGADGWTTTDRGDLIEIPLPSGIDTRQGRMELTVTGFEWDLSTAYFEQWVLVSLDNQGSPFTSTPTGQPGLQSLYRGYNPDYPSRSYRATAYLNLADASCTDWHDCTDETSTSGGWLADDGTSYTFVHEWSGCADTVTFSGNGDVVDTMDLAATSPAGELYDAQMFFLINACGGSTVNACGAWDGPSKWRGGPIGVTYRDIRLELY